MANLKNAKKRILVNERKNKVNSLYRASMKTAIKNTEKAILSGDAKTAKDALQVAIKRIDKAASKGVITPNFVARKKSRLTKKVNEMK
jgi:small subunit ribosomal protein S20